MLYAAAALPGGLEPDLASDTGWWGAPVWEYAYYALVIYLRVAAERTGGSVSEPASDLLQRYAPSATAPSLVGARRSRGSELSTAR